MELLEEDDSAYCLHTVANSLVDYLQDQILRSPENQADWPEGMFLGSLGLFSAATLRWIQAANQWVPVAFPDFAEQKKIEGRGQSVALNLDEQV